MGQATLTRDGTMARPGRRAKWIDLARGGSLTGEAAVELRGVRKRYGEIESPRDVRFAVAPGEVVALLGPNGAGKTTAIGVMLGLRKPTAGSAFPQQGRCGATCTPPSAN